MDLAGSEVVIPGDAGALGCIGHGLGDHSGDIGGKGGRHDVVRVQVLVAD